MILKYLIPITGSGDFLHEFIGSPIWEHYKVQGESINAFADETYEVGRF